MRCFRLTLCLLAGVLLASCSLQAQQDLPQELTLPEALDYARRHSPLLQAAKEDIQAARGSEVTARLRPNPSLNLNSESYPLFESTRGPFFSNQELTLTYEQPIETARKRYWRQRVASAQRETAESQTKDAERLMRLAVQQAHSQVLLAEADLASAREMLADYDRILAVQKARFDKGGISGGELRRIEIERFRFLDDVLAAENGARNAKASLLTMIGYPHVDRNVNAAGSLDVRPVERNLSQLIEDAMQNRPDIAAQRSRLVQAQREHSLQKANSVPDISPYVGYKRDDTMNTVAWGIRIPLPLFNRNQGEVARAEAASRGQDFRLLMEEQQVRQDVVEAGNNFQTQERRLKEIQNLYLGRARESRDIAAESYRLGAVDLLVLLDAQRTYREMVRTYNRARYAAAVGRFELEAAVGKEL